ncbi:hypothetical protein LCGC14_2188860 [marine sediment metagenome]|uniref:Antitoxin n=1 Tax=marine sediment metagenome TaxID=412755 RepID=A0A0F9E776_9ZZZZ
MRRSIKLDEHVYEQLEYFQDKKESFSQAIERLLAVKNQLLEVISIMEGRISFLKWQSDRANELKEKERR